MHWLRSAGGDGGLAGDGRRTGAATDGTRARRQGAGVTGLQRRPLLRAGQVATAQARRRWCSWTAAPAPPQGGAGGHSTRPASTSTSRLKHGGGSGPPQRCHPRGAVLTEDAVPVMTERIKKPGAASHTAARRLGGATGVARAPQNSSEERESHACACATPYWRGAETLRGKLRSSLSSRGKPGPPSRRPAVRPAVSTPSLSTPLPLSSGHARRAAPPAIYGRRAGVRCARIYAWGSGDLRDQAADGRRSRYSPLTPYLTLPPFIP